VLTDGESYDSVSVAAQNLLSDGVEVFAVGVAGFKHVQLLAIANSNETNVIELNDFNDLTTKIGEIAKKVCSHASEGMFQLNDFRVTGYTVRVSGCQ